MREIIIRLQKSQLEPCVAKLTLGIRINKYTQCKSMEEHTQKGLNYVHDVKEMDKPLEEIRVKLISQLVDGCYKRSAKF
jgi:hypothetical protein